MTFKCGDKGKTRGGDDYELIAVLDRPLAIGGNLVAIIRKETGWFLRSYHSDGRGDPLREDEDDLIPPKKKIEGWMAIYPEGTLLPVFCGHKGGHPTGPIERPIAYVPITIEYEDGEGLS